MYEAWEHGDRENLDTYFLAEFARDDDGRIANANYIQIKALYRPDPSRLRRRCVTGSYSYEFVSDLAVPLLNIVIRKVEEDKSRLL